MNAPALFELVRHAPSPAAAGLIERVAGYRESSPIPITMRETASLLVPLVISFGSPFSIALGREPDAADRQPSFAAGLYAGPVMIGSDGAAECIQIDFTPLGAYRFFGGAVGELAGNMVDIGAVLGADGLALRQRLAETASWPERFELAEAFVLRRARHEASREIAFAYGHLARSDGAFRVTALAGEIGWSRKHLVQRFRDEIGMPPKTVARMMRFRRACRDAAALPGAGWADIAHGAGYADQAHLVREFGEFAGETPTAWARRMAASDPRIAGALTVETG